jgi:hypothetical protein
MALGGIPADKRRLGEWLRGWLGGCTSTMAAAMPRTAWCGVFKWVSCRGGSRQAHRRHKSQHGCARVGRGQRGKHSSKRERS